jgi:photosystem II stability/assembly factor-like uncharacterized protein
MTNLTFSFSKMLLALLFTAGFSFSIRAQINPESHPDWNAEMQNPELDFNQLLNLHDSLWPVVPTERGQGFKQFERYKWLHSTRLNENDQPYTGAEIIRLWEELKSYGSNRSLNGNWSPLGPILDDVTTRDQIEGVGRTCAIAFHPTDANIIFLGTPAGGLWRSTDGGGHWETNTDLLPTLGISSIVFDPIDPNIIYAGTGDRDAGDSPGMGVIKSTDGGETWDFFNSGIESYTVNCLRIQPGSNDLMACTTEGIYKSTDGGITWTQLTQNTLVYKDLEFHPTNPEIMYATATGRFYRSGDNGQTWNWIQSVVGSSTRMVLAVTPAAPDYLYVLKTNTYEFVGFYRSTDGGLSFTEMSDTPNIMGWAADGSSTGGQAWYDLCLEADHINPDIVYAGGIRVKKSTDGGATWADINSNYVHVDHHELAISPITKELFLCNDGGLYQYQNNAEWKDISQGVVNGQIYQLAQSPHSAYHTLTGFQDNGTSEFNGIQWQRKGGGDGFECSYDSSDPAWRYSSIYYGALYRTSPDFINQKICGNGELGINEEGAWNTPWFVADWDPNIMMVGLKNVWRTMNVKAAEHDSIVWQKISSNLGGNDNSDIGKLETCLSSHNILYATEGTAKLFRSNNALSESPTWTNISSALPIANAPVSALETNHLDSNIVYLAFNGNAYKSINQGQSWTSITPNLPDISINTIVIDKTSLVAEALYIGTDMGIYYKDSTMVDWINFGSGFPTAARVTELEIYYDSNPSQSRLKASTYGRGLWESDLYSAETNNFPAVAMITTGGNGNEVFGTFDAEVLFYKNLEQQDVTGLTTSDIWASNATVLNVSGGPSIYTVQIQPTASGPIKLVVIEDAAIDLSNIGTAKSDTLNVFFAEAPDALGPFGPGGVGDAQSLSLWLRADRGTVLTAGVVQSWNDLSGNSITAIQNTNEERPLLVENEEGINGRPALYFDGDNDNVQIDQLVPGRSLSGYIMVETDSIAFNDHGWFASARQPNGYLMHPWKNQSQYHSEVLDLDENYSSTPVYYIGDASAPHIYGFTYHQDDQHQVFNTIFDDNIYPFPGVNIGSRDNVTPIDIRMGRDFGDRYGKGKIAEHFLYSVRLMSAQNRIVSNYMAAQYGIDLGPLSLYHHTEQNLEVIGIGRATAYDKHEDAQGLGVIRISNASSMDDGDYLLIGDDEESLDFVTGTYPILSSRTARTWGFTETGDVGSIAFRVAANTFTDTQDLGIIIYEGNEFQAGVSVTFIPLLVQGPILEAQVDFPSSGVFTIGKAPQVSVPNLSLTEIMIYPNPASESLRLVLRNAWPDSWSIKLHNSFGQLVLQEKFNSSEAAVNISDLSAGVYVLDVQIDGITVRRTRVVVR